MKKRTRRGERRTRNTTDLKFDINRLADKRYVGGEVLLMGQGGWNAREAEEVRCQRRPCPVCSDKRMWGNRYCAYCDRSGQDGRLVFPGLPIDYAPDPTYKGSGPSYRPQSLPGGQGAKAKPGKVKASVDRRKTNRAKRRRTG